MKYLISLFFLLGIFISSANAERHVLYFNATWCGWCKVSSEILHQKDVEGWINTYDSNAVVDIDKYPAIKTALKVRSVPTVLIVETESDTEESYIKSKILYRWQLDNTRDKGKARLLSNLYKLSPKRKPTKKQVPFFQKRIIGIFR